MRWLMAFFILMAAQTAGEASVLHWTTRILSLNCDNHPVVQRRSTSEIPQLAYRQEDSDVLTATRFEAERPFGQVAKLILGVCNGEVHILPAQTPGMLKITVQLGASLHHEQHPKAICRNSRFHPNSRISNGNCPATQSPKSMCIFRRTPISISTLATPNWRSRAIAATSASMWAEEKLAYM